MFPATMNRSFNGHVRRVLTVTLATLLLFTALAIVPGSPLVPQAHASTGISLDQCANGTASSPSSPCLWQNGNLNPSSSAHLLEGYSVPYRAVMTDIPASAGAITLDIEYDIKTGGRHAIDYLTSYERYEPHLGFGHPAETVSPIGDLSSVLPGVSTYPIPAPSFSGSPVSGQPTTSFNSLPGSERVMTLFGGAISDIQYISQGDLNAAKSSTSVRVTFTPDPTGGTVVLAWGGHIADASEWGDGNAAGGVNGSAYHTRLLHWSLGNIGNQDRSLKASSVFPDGTIIIKKIAEGGNDTFHYSAAGSVIGGDFSLATSGGTASKSFVGVLADDGGNNSGIYTFEELLAQLPSGWTFEGLSCVEDRTDNTTVNGEVATVHLDPNETVTCTYTNALVPRLKLVKKVTNDNGGLVPATDWTLTASGASGGFSEQATGTDTEASVGPYAVDPGVTYTLSESGPGGYSPTSWSCVGATLGGAGHDQVTLAPGDDATCTITNDDIAPTLKLVKQVKNDNGGTASATDWTLTASGTSGGFSEKAVGAADEASVGPKDVTAKVTYTLSESGPAGYSASAWSCSINSGTPVTGNTITLNEGDYATCTIVNDDQQAYITVVKKVNNNAGGTAKPNDFKLTLDGAPVTSGVKVPVDPGTYTADETLLPGYTFDGYSGACDVSGEIRVNLGDDVTCTLTNSDIAPILTLVKTVKNDNGGLLTQDDFPSFIDGSAVDWDTPTAVNANIEITVSETAQSGYTPSVWGGDCAADGTITLLPGDNKTCTITNDDSAASIDIEKATNGEDADLPTGPYIPVNGAVTWTYKVTNTGQADLEQVLVEDSDNGLTVTCPETTLAVGESMTCEATGIAAEGQYANVGTAFATAVTGAPVKATDPSHYYGVTGGIDIEKSTNDLDADLPTGPQIAVGDAVNWEYRVKNLGNTPLANVVVTDDQGVTPLYKSGDLNTDGLLDPLETWVYTASGVAVAGQYANIGTVTAIVSGLTPSVEVRALEAVAAPPAGIGDEVTDSDPSHYFGVDSSIDLVKTGAFGIGDDGIANPGDVITYEFEVTNTGNVPLTNIDVEDLDLGGINVSCPKTDLAVGESMTCTADYPVTQDDINSGTVHNCALAAGLDPLEDGVSDEDCFDTDIPQSPAIDIVKDVEPTIIPVNAAADITTDVTWTITVTNTGNVPLHDVVVTDALAASCDKKIGDLALGGSTTYTCDSSLTPTGPAWSFTNVAVTTGVGPLGDVVTADNDATVLPIEVAGSAEIGDTVWLDSNKNGIQDADEAGINGAKVLLKDASGTVIATATTAHNSSLGADGWYKFVGLDAGTYTSQLDTSSVSGELTTAGAFTIDLADGEEYLDADFGVAETLPKTGMNSEELGLVALALLLLGALAVLATRKRRGEEQ